MRFASIKSVVYSDAKLPKERLDPPSRQAVVSATNPFAPSEFVLDAGFFIHIFCGRSLEKRG